MAIIFAVACQVDQKPCSAEGLAELTRKLQQPHLTTRQEISYLQGYWKYLKPCDPHHRISRTMAGVDAVINIDTPTEGILRLKRNPTTEAYWRYFQEELPIDLLVFDLGSLEYDNKAELMTDIRKAVIAHYSHTAVDHAGDVSLASLLSVPPSDFEIERACAYIKAFHAHQSLPARTYLVIEKIYMMSETTCRFI